MSPIPTVPPTARRPAVPGGRTPVAITSIGARQTTLPRLFAVTWAVMTEDGRDILQNNETGIAFDPARQSVSDPGSSTRTRPAAVRAAGRAARAVLGRIGYELHRSSPPAAAPTRPPDIDDATATIIETVRPFTMTPPDRVVAMCLATRYVAAAGLDGAIVECGVWRGGSMMAAALSLLGLGVRDIDLYLFDAFDKMPMPTDRDIDAWGRPAARLFEGGANANEIPELAVGPMERVQANLRSTGYPASRIKFVKGLVEDTIPAQAPERIALLRLDTDWYESTAHEMRHLFPRLVDGGVLIVDDYGLFRGARDAVDEFLSDAGVPVLLNRIDFAGRVGVIHHGLTMADASRASRP